jgi:hypothetical protein
VLAGRIDGEIAYAYVVKPYKRATRIAATFSIDRTITRVARPADCRISSVRRAALDGIDI